MSAFASPSKSRGAPFVMPTRIDAHAVWPSTVALTLAVPAAPPAVNPSVAFPLTVGADGDAKAPSVPANAAVVPSGTVPPAVVSVPFESKLSAAVMLDGAPVPTEEGDVAAFKIRYGDVVAAPATPLG